MPNRARLELRADCTRCVGLCCVALPFTRSADFAIDKPAGVPCPNLRADSRCDIHAELRDRGFAGCAAFDCFGAGQRVVREYGDAGPEAMSAVFATARQVHEMLWHLTEAASRAPSPRLRDRIEGLTADLEAASLAALDVPAQRAIVGAALAEISAAVRAGLPGASYRHADLVGTDLRAVELRGADLRGGLLVGADLAGVVLDRADLLGADLRAAELRGADLGTALFLTQPQVDAARGTATTVLPPRLHRPAHWPAG